MKPEVLIVAPMVSHVMEALEKSYTAHRLWEAKDSDSFLQRIGKNVRAIATKGDKGASAALMGALQNLEIVACYGVGVDAIDLAHARSRNILVTNTPDVLNDDVANLAVALVFATSRKIAFNDRYVRAGKWPTQGDPPLARSILGKRVGILGLGRIGKDIARKLEAFGCAIAYHGRREQKDVAYRFYPELVAMAKESDFLIAILPGGAGTQAVVNRAVLEALGPEGTFINVARGSVVDETALVDCLQSGRLGAAGLDVFVREPHVPEALLAMDQVVLQPHQGSGTVETRRTMGDLVIENLALHFAGKPVRTPVG